MTTRRTFLLASSGALAATLVGCDGGEGSEDAGSRAARLDWSFTPSAPAASVRVDTQSLIPGAMVVGTSGLGVVGSAIPAAGTHGAAFLYNDLVLPADAGKEIRGLLLTSPAAGKLFAYEDGSFTFTDAPDGSYSFEYRLFVDGANLGTATVAIDIGAT